MATITGTDRANVLYGTSGNDELLGLDGNDRLVASGGNDILNGGSGTDTADYRNLDENITLTPRGFLNKSGGGQDQLVEIETIWGNTNRVNTIDASSANGSGGGIDVDLSTNTLKAYIPSLGFRDFTIKNFSDIVGTDRGSRFVGNYRNNRITGGSGDDYIVGSRGNDTLNGGGGLNTLDYSGLGRAVKILPRGKIEKSGFGTDITNNFSKIIGATNQTNTIDASSDTASTASLNVNLANNSLGINNIPVGDTVVSQQFEVVNFVNVVGSKNNDSIVGGNVASKLVGGGGSDTVSGGNQNDSITGTNRAARGVGEVDNLSGGGGSNKFILGDNRGAYYLGNGASDFAMINDFNLFTDSIDLGRLRDYSFGVDASGIIDLFSGRDVNTRDLIAKIQLTNDASALNRTAKSTMGGSKMLAMGAAPMMSKASGVGLDSSGISSQINILSGASSIAESVV
jgi:RTX calcium-binding nonapeptide repeat (4 copies)